jgi:hypothetical protein
MHHDGVTGAAAGAAVTSPWWLPQLHNISVIAAELAPILGAIWLLLQIFVKLYSIFSKCEYVFQTKSKEPGPDERGSPRSGQGS